MASDHRAEFIDLVADYRRGEIPPLDTTRLDKWLGQFDQAKRDGILAELLHVMKSTYVSTKVVDDFLSGLVTNASLAGQDPAKFWRSANVLNIQRHGSSQKELTDRLAVHLKKTLNLDTSNCGTATGPFVYLDDVVFTGNTIRYDIEQWLTSVPDNSALHIVCIAFHRGGQWYANDRIQRKLSELKKNVTVTWWRSREFEDRKSAAETSDTLKLTSVPDNADSRAYVEALKAAGYPPVFRKPNAMKGGEVFSGEVARHLLEQEMWAAGLRIRAVCKNLPANHRPLGYQTLSTFGFGSLVVTYRNCPNTCPLALWAETPWVPLFPRKSN